MTVDWKLIELLSSCRPRSAPKPAFFASIKTDIAFFFDGPRKAGSGLTIFGRCDCI
jgi:hypothetical protein